MSLSSPPILALTVIAYLIGAIPTGYLLGRLYGKDLRQHGSGNIGATNAGRVFGKGIGVLTLLLDIAKGMLVVALAAVPGSTLADPHSCEPLAALLGAAGVCGHCFSPFLKFRGGKGVATGLGVFLLLAPWAAATALTVFALTTLASGYISLGSVVSVLILPILVIAAVPAASPPSTEIAAVLVSAVILFRHRGNIARLLSGTERTWRKNQADTCSSASGTK